MDNSIDLRVSEENEYEFLVEFNIEGKGKQEIGYIAREKEGKIWLKT